MPYFNEVREPQIIKRPLSDYENESAEKTLSFTDTSYIKAEIKLRIKPYGWKSHLAYVIDVQEPISRSSFVNLRLLDKDGFELYSFCAGSVIDNFLGKLKGQGTLPKEVYDKIAGAELFLTVGPERAKENK
jgi:hypothetical protein